jgi:hypothetical protein
MPRSTDEYREAQPRDRGRLPELPRDARLGRVVRVIDHDREQLVRDPNFVYCGRACYGWAQSAWANPFKIGMSLLEATGLLREVLNHEQAVPLIAAPQRRELSPKDAVNLFEGWLLGQPDLVARLPELRGKTLGCWCVNWEPGSGPPEKPCHAVTLWSLAQSPLGIDQDRISNAKPLPSQARTDTTGETRLRTARSNDRV